MKPMRTKLCKKNIERGATMRTIKELIVLLREEYSERVVALRGINERMDKIRLEQSKAEKKLAELEKKKTVLMAEKGVIGIAQDFLNNIEFY